jgi:hypothetical protein
MLVVFTRRGDSSRFLFNPVGVHRVRVEFGKDKRRTRNGGLLRLPPMIPPVGSVFVGMLKLNRRDVDVVDGELIRLYSRDGDLTAVAARR